MKYAYLVASLPGLVLGERPPFRVDNLRFRCIGVLESGDLRELDLVLAARAGEGASSFSKRWHGMDTQLRNAVARHRARAAGVESKVAARPHFGFSTYIEKAVAESFFRPNPAERELMLDRCRWELLEELSREQPFGLSEVLAYAVKLQIAERWAGMSDETGREIVQKIVEEKRSSPEAS